MKFSIQWLQPKEQQSLFWERRNRLFPSKIAWTWSMVFIGICLYAMMWFIFGRVAFEIVTAVEASYTFPSPAQDVINIVKYVIAYHPLIAVFGWLLWGFINSSRRSVRSYEQV